MEETQKQTEPTQQPVKPVKQFNWLIIAVVFIILILLSTAGTYYFLSQRNQKQNSATKTGDENEKPTSSITTNVTATKDWNVCTNKNLGYSIKYPSNWVIIKSSNDCSIFSSPTKNILTDKPALINIEMVKTSEVKQILDKLTPVFAVKTVSRFDATYVLYVSTYMEGAAPTKEIEQLGKNTLDQMYSTFKFTDQSQPVITQSDTSNWKTHSDSQLGYEIKYPSNWKSPFNSESQAPWWTTGTSTDNDNVCVVTVSQSGGEKIAGIVTTIMIDGVSGSRITSSSSSAGAVEAVYVNFNGNNLTIGRSRGSGNKIETQCVETFNQMLSTFKFIK